MLSLATGFLDYLRKIEVQHARHPQEGIQGGAAHSSLDVAHPLPRQTGSLGQSGDGQILSDALSVEDLRHAGADFLN